MRYPMHRAATLALIERYYTAFNAGDWQGMLDCLSDDVAHDINQGTRQSGKAAFTAFLAHMERCYKERLDDIVIMASDDGTRAAAEFVACRPPPGRPMSCRPAPSWPWPTGASPG
eukprot:gene5580-5637_t